MNNSKDFGLTPEKTQQTPSTPSVAVPSDDFFAQEEKRFLALVEGISEMAKVITGLTERSTRIPLKNNRAC
jgi:hypothetical protein